MFQERECVGGGWNYGSRETLGVNLPPYVQTTAVALLGLGDTDPNLADRGVAELERSWRSEIDGLLSTATTACALDLFGSPHAGSARDAVAATIRDGAPDTVVAAWTAFALGGRGPWLGG
jgi:hypothetical protein